MRSSAMKLEPCRRKPTLGQRPFMGSKDAVDLARLFKMLANDTRLRLLHALARAGELSVTQLAEALDMKPQAISNQLQKLVDRQLLVNRRQGNASLYRIADLCVLKLLDRGWCLAEESHRRQHEELARPDVPLTARRHNGEQAASLAGVT